MLIHFVLSDSLKFDHGICENVKSITMTSRAELHDLQRGHCEKTTVIAGNADTSLGDDYTVSNVSLFGIYIRRYIIVVCLLCRTWSLTFLITSTLCL
jgi:hypothetical protein